MNAMNYFLALSPPVSIDEYKNSIIALFNRCSSIGVTCLHDCGIGAIDPDLDYPVILAAMEENPPMRFSGYLVSTYWDKWVAMGL